MCPDRVSGMRIEVVVVTALTVSRPSANVPTNLVRVMGQTPILPDGPRSGGMIIGVSDDIRSAREELGLFVLEERQGQG